MKSKVCCWVLAVLGLFAVLAAGLVALIVFAVTRGAGEKFSVHDNSYLLIELTGPLEDYRAAPRYNIFADRDSPTLAEAKWTLEHGRDDARIKGVVLRPSGTSGFAALRELRESVRKFKSSSKPVYAYLELATDRDYYLASIADSIVMVPSNSGGLIMLGVGIASTYLGGTFEKVGLKFNVLHVGDFKGAYENLGQERMSDSLRLSLQVLVDDVFETYVSEIRADRALIDSALLVSDLLDGRDYLISGSEAISRGYADIVLDWQGFRRHLGGGEEPETVTASRYAKSVVQDPAAKEIAVVFAEGAINYVADPTDPLNQADAVVAENFVEQLRDLRENDGVVAVVLRVNSPGGSSLASELILQEVKRLKAVKPLVVSMGNIAASGGYYISCTADYVVAQPNSITGSIGVVSVIPTGEELFRKIAARVEVVEKGKWHNFFRFDKSLSHEQERVLLSLMDGIYRDFVTHVAEGRHIPISEVESVASGRVWTGTQALERHLIDELGGMDVAIGKAEELAGVSAGEVQLRFYPKEEPFLRFLADRLGITMKQFQQGIWSTEEERQLMRAAEYLNGFANRREFVQLLAPIDTEF